MRNMIDEILNRETELKNQIERKKKEAEEIKKEADTIVTQILNQSLDEAKKEADNIMTTTKQQIKTIESEKLNEIEISKQYAREDGLIEKVADKIIDQYFFGDK